MYLEIFLADFAVFRVFLGISRDFAEIPEFRGSATARNIRSPVQSEAEVLVERSIFADVFYHLVTGREICIVPFPYGTKMSRAVIKGLRCYFQDFY